MSSSLPERIESFLLWMDKELDQRGWTDSQFAIHAGLNPSVVSKARAGSLPGWKACKAMATALGYPPEYVFRIAGHLDPDPKLSPSRQRLLAMIAMLTENQVEELLNYCLYLISRTK